jgi:hypothetical protein
LPLPPATDGCWAAPLQRLAAALERVETFYDSMGGLVGYQLKSLQLIIANTKDSISDLEPNNGAGAGSSMEASSSGGSSSSSSSSSSVDSGSGVAPAGGKDVTYHVPPALDLAGEGGRRVGARAAAQGIMSLPFMAEILPVGGGQAGGQAGLRQR